jgi:Protein of unknown function (DUF3489)/IclR helix-turn-helix domain
MPETAKTLSAAQVLVLTTAARRPARMALPLPAGLRVGGAARRALLASLLERGLVEERPTDDQALSWRWDGRGRHQTLRITAAGLAAAGGDRPAATQTPDAADGPALAPAAEPAAAAPTAAARPGGKLGQVLDAVAAEDGATLAELAALTGWQPHTARAALTRLRRRGFILVLGSADSAGDRKAYRAVPA